MSPLRKSIANMNLDQAQLPRLLSESGLALIKELQGHRFVYFVDEATVTDRLAHCGMLAAMDRASSPYHITSSVEDIDAQVAANSVGTAIFCNLVSDAAKLQRSGAKIIVVLPQSMFGGSGAPTELQENVLLLCRDLMTLQSMRTSILSARCALAHHMAFNLSVRKILIEEEIGAAARSALAGALDLSGTSLDKIAAHQRISIFRDRQRGTPGAASFPLETVVARLHRDLGVRPAVWGFLQILSRARGVSTDSIEVAIGCALLGVECELLGKTDGESAWVFETSLSLFDHMRFVPSA